MAIPSSNTELPPEGGQEYSSFATSRGVTPAEAALMAYDSRTASGRLSVKKLSYSHEAMADLIIAEPAITQGRIGEIFGRTGGWVSIILASDAFKSYLALRKQELQDPILIATIKDRFQAVVDLSTERLLEKLHAPNVADSTVLKAMELGAKALGVGGNAPPTPPPGDHLSTLAERLLALQSTSRRSIYGQIEEVEAREIGRTNSPDTSEPHPPAISNGAP